MFVLKLSGIQRIFPNLKLLQIYLESGAVYVRSLSKASIDLCFTIFWTLFDVILFWRNYILYQFVFTIQYNHWFKSIKIINDIVSLRNTKKFFFTWSFCLLELSCCQTTDANFACNLIIAFANFVCQFLNYFSL